MTGKHSNLLAVAATSSASGHPAGPLAQHCDRFSQAMCCHGVASPLALHHVCPHGVASGAGPSLPCNGRSISLHSCGISEASVARSFHCKVVTASQKLVTSSGHLSILRYCQMYLKESLHVALICPVRLAHPATPVEKPKSTSEHVSSRCQLMSTLVELCQGSPASISDFGRLLLLESYHLSQVSRALSSCQYFDFDVINLNFFSDAQAFVAENFRLSWMDSESHFFPYFS